MKNKTGKITGLFSLYVGLHFVAAACIDCNCGGNHVIPFFDYHTLSIATNAPAQENILKIDIQPTDVYYLAGADVPSNKVSLITTAMACSCSENGEQGAKFPVVALNVFSDRDFSATIPVDSSLTSLFTYSQFASWSAQDYPLDQPEINDFYALRLRTSTQPAHPELPIRFTIQVIKSNHDTISMQTDTIRFQ